jgi:hypothetical protein
VKALEWRHLRRFCKEHGLDEMEIDSTLTYWENKKHLESLVADFGQEDRLDEWRSQQDWYLENHALTNYIMHAREGETVSKEMGRPPTEFRFSLASYIVAQH